jgi:hypothetical protein
MEINWHDPAVQASIITGVFGLIAAVIAAICATAIGTKIADRKRLEEKLKIACGDIAFLLAVERQHCTIHQKTSETEQSLKLVVRREVEDAGHTWSGRFTPGRARQLFNRG